MYVMCLDDWGPSLTHRSRAESRCCIFNCPVVTEAVWISDLQEKAPHMRYLWGEEKKSVWSIMLTLGPLTEA